MELLKNKTNHCCNSVLPDFLDFPIQCNNPIPRSVIFKSTDVVINAIDKTARVKRKYGKYTRQMIWI